jgi:hypothetical protein
MDAHLSFTFVELPEEHLESHLRQPSEDVIVHSLTVIAGSAGMELATVNH